MRFEVQAACARWLCVGLVAGALAPAGAGADPPRVAVLMSSSISPFSGGDRCHRRRAPACSLPSEVTTFDLEGSSDRRDAVIGGVQRIDPHLVVAVGTLATTVALDDAAPRPLVFSMVLFPTASGFLDRPGHPATGASLDIPLDLQFQYLQRLVPSAQRVGVLYDPDETGSIVAAAQRAAEANGFTLIAERVPDPAKALDAMQALVGRIDAVWSVADSHVFTPQTTSALILATLRAGVPMLGVSAAQVRSGAVAALTCDYADVGRQSAELALQVLRGVSPSALPVTVPRRVGLALNLRSAAHLGLHIPPELAAEASEVVR